MKVPLILQNLHSPPTQHQALLNSSQTSFATNKSTIQNLTNNSTDFQSISADNKLLLDLKTTLRDLKQMTQGLNQLESAVQKTGINVKKLFANQAKICRNFNKNK
ncbi:Hypothetical_protein [Hexamita inflata]|uniref:Hypothetical_protein n=1 Tax=Hexamita inflata TaxID=28002 RepID=A0AA86UT19_9EUKA|nr:Hypothetical protein HINF_LOCUS54509 [Hexamita inflata]